MVKSCNVFLQFAIEELTAWERSAFPMGPGPSEVDAVLRVVLLSFYPRRSLRGSNIFGNLEMQETGLGRCQSR